MPSISMAFGLVLNQLIGFSIKPAFCSKELIMPLYEANSSEKISPMMTAEMTAGIKSVTLKKDRPFSFLFSKTASSSARGISTTSLPADSTTVFNSDCQKSGSRLNTRTKFCSPVKFASPKPL